VQARSIKLLVLTCSQALCLACSCLLLLRVIHRLNWPQDSTGRGWIPHWWAGGMFLCTQPTTTEGASSLPLRSPPAGADGDGGGLSRRTEEL